MAPSTDHTTMKKTIAALLPLLLAACAGVTDPEAARDFRGLYSWGFEVSAFQPCGTEAQWWVVGGDSIVERYTRLVQQSYSPVYVSLRGRAGPEGTFGHLGAYTRELEVDRVVEMRAARPGECEPA